MHTRQTRLGLGIAAVLAVIDFAIIIPFVTNADPRPPAGIVVLSVAIGAVTLFGVMKLWNANIRNWAIAVIALRAVSALGDLTGVGEGDLIALASIVLLLVSLVDIYLLRGLVAKPQRSLNPRM